jgi:heme-degrading monooxygenase HmoA
MSYVIVFRSRLRPGVEEAYGRRAEEIYALAEQMPGLVSAKDFTAEDGERVAIVEFDTEAHLLAWRDHVEHRRAQAQGRESFYTAYSIQICRVERSAAFDHAAGTWEQRPARW